MGTRITGFNTLDALDLTCLAAGTVAADVRQRIALRLDGWGLSALTDDVRLIATELVTNACAATPHGQIRVRFTREAGAVLLAVWDASDRMPQARPVEVLDLDDLDLSPANLDRNGGRGLHLVRALAAECGVRRTEPRGKWVFARTTLPEVAGQPPGTGRSTR